MPSSKANLPRYFQVLVSLIIYFFFLLLSVIYVTYVVSLPLVCVSRPRQPFLLFRPLVWLGLEMGRAKPALGRAGPGYWAGWVMKIVEP